MRFDKGKAPDEDAQFQMAPMIDIIFQLLIFFMVIANLEQLTELAQVKLPVASEAKTIDTTMGLIRINLTSNGNIVFGEKQRVLEPAELVVELSDRTMKNAKVLIRGDRDVKHRRILEVMNVCAEAGLWNVSFAVFQEEPAE